MQLTAGNRVLQSNWEGVAESLLSGILVSGHVSVLCVGADLLPPGFLRNAF